MLMEQVIEHAYMPINLIGCRFPTSRLHHLDSEQVWLHRQNPLTTGSSHVVAPVTGPTLSPRLA